MNRAFVLRRPLCQTSKGLGVKGSDLFSPPRTCQTNSGLGVRDGIVHPSLQAGHIGDSHCLVRVRYQQMSLNICVATDFGIFQSSDLQLTELSQGRSGLIARQIIAPSPKVVVLQYFDWQAVITYIGLAKLGGTSTADWLSRQMTHSGGQRSVTDVVETIRAEATRAVARLSLPAGYPPFHTFTVGVLARGKAPQVFMISNYESRSTRL